jgi:hypothetical protein
VFKRGKPQGDNAKNPSGGHTDPTQIVGDKLALKKAQKKLKKNITSLRIKSSIPKRNPRLTTRV